MPADPIRQRYEPLAYSFGPHRQVNIGHLHAVARFLGHPAARPEQARVLEIGCGAGADLLAMAAVFPQATFFGMLRPSGKKPKKNQSAVFQSKSTGRVEVANAVTADFLTVLADQAPGFTAFAELLGALKERRGRPLDTAERQALLDGSHTLKQLKTSPEARQLGDKVTQFLEFLRTELCT